MADSKIEWTDKTWNPVTGCDKISPGCAYELQDAALALQASTEALKEVVNACQADIAAKCGMVQPGQGRVAACLVGARASVSKDCASAIQKVESLKTP